MLDIAVWDMFDRVAELDRVVWLFHKDVWLPEKDLHNSRYCCCCYRRRRREWRVDRVAGTLGPGCHDMLEFDASRVGDAWTWTTHG